MAGAQQQNVADEEGGMLESEEMGREDVNMDCLSQSR